MGPARKSTGVPWSASTKISVNLSKASRKNCSIIFDSSKDYYRPVASSNGSWSVVVSWLNDVLFIGPKYTDVHATLSRLLSPTPPPTAKSTQLLLKIIVHHSHPHQADLTLLVDIHLQWYLLVLFLASPDLLPRSYQRRRLSRSNGEVTAGYER